MFGNAPRAMWERWIAPDAATASRWPVAACWCATGGRTILFETGIGAFFAPAMRDRYGVVEELPRAARSPGGSGCARRRRRRSCCRTCTSITPAARSPRGPRARRRRWRSRARSGWSAPAAWDRAVAPHARDRASFIPELPALLEATGRLEKVAGARSDALGDGYRFHHSDGHTPGLLLAELDAPGGPIVFAADLIPGRPWVHVPITMGYDRYPELLIEEKQALLTELAARGGRLFFTHDPTIAIGTVARDERGRFHTVDERALLDE
jgi:hypothetical protein